jgi:predicted short-subunit dehydrogenase-like oxidoreductase (DUF2520 family)
MKVTLIGSGNVNTVLARLITAKGHTIEQVYSRHLAHAQELAGKHSAAATDDFTQLNNSSDIYIISVSDNALPEIAELLRLGDKVVVHTTGAAPIATLQQCSSHYGVLYPVQSLRKELEHLPEIPFTVDGSDSEVRAFVLSFAQTLSSVVQVANDDQRLKTHVAAVFVSNFTNFLYAQAEAYCNFEGIQFNSLLPLIQEVASRIKDSSPAKVQTGPAIRRDFVTIERHMQLLQEYPQLSEMYKFLTDGVLEFYK